MSVVNGLERCLEKFDKHVGCVVFRKIPGKFSL